MGQQQLLLIILGVIIVGIAVAVGITMFTGGARDANRDQVINDLVNLSAKSQQFYRRPFAMGGGGNSFVNFQLTIADTGNANGSYSVTSTLPSGTAGVPGDTARYVGSAAGPLYIVGCGKELGNNNLQNVKAYITVNPTTSATISLN